MYINNVTYFKLVKRYMPSSKKKKKEKHGGLFKKKKRTFRTGKTELSIE